MPPPGIGVRRHEHQILALRCEQRWIWIAMNHAQVDQLA